MKRAIQLGIRAVVAAGVLAISGGSVSGQQSDSLKGFKDEQGNMFWLPVTAYTYQGSDGKHYSLAVLENKQIVMAGVWSDEANRVASNFTDPALFRVLFTKK